VIITDPPWGVGFDEHDNFDVFLQVRDELYNLKASSFMAGMANSYKLPKALVSEELYGFW
jgi:hypothetical protein